MAGAAHGSDGTPAALVADSTSAEIAAFSAEDVKTFGAEHAHARAAT